jgi:hypothetical protein
MRKIGITLVGILVSISIFSQNLVGAWEATITTSEGVDIKNVVIFSENYMASTWFNTKDGEFRSVNGGSWKLNGNTLEGNIEFDSRNSDKVGSQMIFDLIISESELKVDGVDIVWKKLDNGTPGDLCGAWLMSGRKRDGKIETRNTDQPRKTLKILSETRFQWIAYNTETKQFMATGGGSYTTIGSKYTENIEFFSKDKTRVGAELSFDFSLLQNEWHHAGFSSKGDPLYEIWSIRE